MTRKIIAHSEDLETPNTSSSPAVLFNKIRDVKQMSAIQFKIF